MNNNKVLIYQPTAVVTATLSNNAALSMRCITLQNKDGIGLPYEQFAKSLLNWCFEFREKITASKNLKPEDFEVKEKMSIFVHFLQNEKSSQTVIVVQEAENKMINDPMLCEAVYNWTQKMIEDLKKAGINV